MTEFVLSDLFPVLPELVLSGCAMVLLLAGTLAGNARTVGVCLASVAALALSGAALAEVEWSGVPALSGMVVLTPFAAVMKFLILIGLALSLLLAAGTLKAERMMRFEYPVLVLLSGVGMMLMVSANNLLALYVGLELQSLALYVLAAFRRDQGVSAEAGLKYFVLGALSSGMFLFGASLLYGFAGSIGFAELAVTVSQAPTLAPGVLLGMVFVLAGLAFKISAVPFHMWTPDVYEGAPTPVTALFAIVPKLAAVALIARLLQGPFGGVEEAWGQIVVFLSVASMAVAAFAGIAQTSVKRLMAYSSIGNMGYALIALVPGTAEGMSALIVYLTIYMLMTAGAFGVILGMRRGGVAVDSISDLSGLSRTCPVAAYCLAILMFSMAGIPPLAGFFGKLLVFKAAVSGGFYVLAVVGMLASVVSAYYYLRIIKVMFFDAPAEAFDREPAFLRRAVVVLCVTIIVAFILVPEPLIALADGAAAVPAPALAPAAAVTP